MATRDLMDICEDLSLELTEEMGDQAPSAEELAEIKDDPAIAAALEEACRAIAQAHAAGAVGNTFAVLIDQARLVTA